MTLHRSDAFHIRIAAYVVQISVMPQKQQSVVKILTDMLRHAINEVGITQMIRKNPMEYNPCKSCVSAGDAVYTLRKSHDDSPTVVRFQSIFH